MMLELEGLVAIVALELPQLRVHVVAHHVTLQPMQIVKLLVAYVAQQIRLGEGWCKHVFRLGRLAKLLIGFLLLELVGDGAGGGAGSIRQLVLLVVVIRLVLVVVAVVLALRVDLLVRCFKLVVANLNHLIFFYLITHRREIRFAIIYSVN